QAATHDLSVGDEIGAHTSPGLRPALRHAKAQQHFVENQRRARFTRKRAQLLQKSARLAVGAATLHWLDDDSSKGMALAGEYFQSSPFIAIIQYQFVARLACRMPTRKGTRCSTGAHLCQRTVEVTVIRAGKHGVALPARRMTSQAQGRH